jgi:hypothetical protein
MPSENTNEDSSTEDKEGCVTSNITVNRKAVTINDLPPAGLKSGICHGNVNMVPGKL